MTQNHDEPEVAGEAAHSGTAPGGPPIDLNLFDRVSREATPGPWWYSAGEVFGPENSNGVSDLIACGFRYGASDPDDGTFVATLNPATIQSWISYTRKLVEERDEARDHALWLIRTATAEGLSDEEKLGVIAHSPARKDWSDTLSAAQAQVRKLEAEVERLTSARSLPSGLGPSDPEAGLDAEPSAAKVRMWEAIRWWPHMPSWAHEVAWTDDWEDGEHERDTFNRLFDAALSAPPASPAAAELGPGNSSIRTLGEENGRLRAALNALMDESVFNQQRFGEDDDTDYFLRCFKAIKDRARQALETGK